MSEEKTKTWEEKKTEYKDASVELLSYLDKKDHIVIFVLLLLTSVGIIVKTWVQFDPIGVLTVISIFFVYMRVRNGQSGSYPEYARILPHFRETQEKDSEELVLKNFGGPGLNLRVYARVETDSGIFESDIVENDETVHLESKGFLPLHDCEFERKGSSERVTLKDIDSMLYRKPEDTYVELFYTFESVSGRGHPDNLKTPTDMPMEKIVKNTTQRIIGTHKVSVLGR